MKSLVEELLDYFDNTPEEQIKRDWDAIHHEFGYGMETHEFIESSRKQIFKVSGISNVNVISAVSGDFGEEIDLSKAA